MKDVTWNAGLHPSQLIGKDSDGTVWISLVHFPGGHAEGVLAARKSGIRTIAQRGSLFASLDWVREQYGMAIEEAVRAMDSKRAVRLGAMRTHFLDGLEQAAPRERATAD